MSVPNPHQAARRYASNAWSSPNRSGATGPAGRSSTFLVHLGHRARDLVGKTLVPLANAPEAHRHLAAKSIRLDRHGPPVEAKYPRCQVLEVRVRSHEHAVLDPA